MTQGCQLQAAMLERNATHSSLEAFRHVGAREAQVRPPLGRPPVAVLGLEVGAAPQPGLLEGCAQVCNHPWASAWWIYILLHLNLKYLLEQGLRSSGPWIWCAGNARIWQQRMPCEWGWTRTQCTEPGHISEPWYFCSLPVTPAVACPWAGVRSSWLGAAVLSPTMPGAGHA